MNILITNDDGFESFGLILLREATLRKFREAKIVTISTRHRMSGMGMGVKCAPKFDVGNYNLEKVDENFILLDGTPTDIVYAAGCSPRHFLPAGVFDLVLSGVNEGANVGLDVLHSGTVGAAMLASAVFGITSYALSQQFPVGNGADGGATLEKATESLFEVASMQLQNLMNDLQLGTGECFNVNFPFQKPRGLVHVKTAPYSRWRDLPNIPNVKERLNFDIERLNEGFVTIAELDLQVNPPLRY